MGTTKKKKKTTTLNKVSRMAAPDAGVKVRMYRQGLGDCFLLAFRSKTGEPFYVLIDCGVLVGQVEGRPSVQDVAQHIATSTGNRLDVIIATHQHWDHLSGFVDAKDVFKKVQIGDVWLAWTENPADALAARMAKKKKNAQIALEKAVARVTNSGPPSMTSSDSTWATALESVCAFLGADKQDRTTEAALGSLRELANGKIRYCAPTDESISFPGLDEVKIYVLGPPQDEQKIKSYNDKKSDPQTYHMAEVALAAQLEYLASACDNDGPAVCPFDERHQISKTDAPQLYAELSKEWLLGSSNQWRAISMDWLRAVTGLALDLDNATNNTSLAIAIELKPRGKVLLFPADAQVGNWMSWGDQSWTDSIGTKVTVDDLLARTVLYKVGHHCSHNATMRQRGLELMVSDDLIAMVPLDQATAKKKNWPMPWPKLRASLLKVTKGRMLQVDDKGLPSDLPVPKDVDRNIWKQFQSSVSGDDMFFEVTIS
jgi:hypothetical protein